MSEHASNCPRHPSLHGCADEFACTCKPKATQPDRIEVGDEVFVVFDQRDTRAGIYGTVLYCPQATGDSFHIRSLGQDKGDFYYVQTFQFIHLRRRPPK